jgi:hypothetical protein
VTNRVRSAKENVAELDACTASLRRNTRVSFPCFMLTGVSTVDENAWYVYNSLERRTAGTMYPAELAAMCRLSWLPVRNQSCRSENISLIVSDAYPGQTPHRRGSSIEHYQLSSGFVRPSGPVRSRDVFNNPVDRRHLRWSGSTQDVLERVLQAGSERAGQVAAPPWRPGQGTPQAREFSRRPRLGARTVLSRRDLGVRGHAQNTMKSRTTFTNWWGGDTDPLRTWARRVRRPVTFRRLHTAQATEGMAHGHDRGQ